MYNAPESIGNTLESGKQVTVNLQLKSEEVVPEEPVWWVDGVQLSDSGSMRLRRIVCPGGRIAGGLIATNWMLRIPALREMEERAGRLLLQT